MIIKTGIKPKTSNGVHGYTTRLTDRQTDRQTVGYTVDAQLERDKEINLKKPDTGNKDN